MITLNDQNFSTEIKQAVGLAVVDFWAPWCGPCQLLGPLIESIAGEFEGKAKFGKFNVDEGLNIPTEFSIQSIPAVLFFKNGELKQSLIGLRSKEEYLNLLNSLL
jgi:thioredoxin 1